VSTTLGDTLDLTLDLEQAARLLKISTDALMRKARAGVRRGLDSVLDL
jgi:hypothetical protein